MKLIQWLKPGTSRRNLLFVAALVWTFTGGMLLTRGILMMDLDSNSFLLRMSLSLTGGALFYGLLFSRISKKHIARIIHLANDNPCIFSFFNPRSYLMMTFMISFGVLLRKSGIIPPLYLSILYVTMGIPLLGSSIRFYYSGIYYHSIVRKKQ
jgi:hypothetical protein